jgi:general secretion pathway protein A
MMYREFFGLDCEPFENTNNSKFFYPSEAHKEALASLLFGIKSAKGILLLTGEIGAGKTQVAQVLKEMLSKDTNNMVCELTNPKLSEIELLQVIAKHIGLPAILEQSQSSNDIFSAIHNELEQKREHNPEFRLALLFDEAQLLSQSVLEKIRLLTNLESNYQKLVQVVLIGQPELTTRLNQHENRPLMQRVAMHRNISYFDEPNTEQYIRFRLAKAGRSQSVFSHGALRKIHIASMGSPRLINLLCDNGLFIGFTKESQTIDESIIDMAIQDVPAGLLNQAIKPVPSVNKEAFNKVATNKPIKNEIDAVNAVDIQAPTLEVEEVKTKKPVVEHVEDENEEDEIPVPEYVPDPDMQHWYNQYWVKAIAFIVAVFIILWIYNAIASLVASSDEEADERPQIMQNSHLDTRVKENLSNSSTESQRYRVQNNQQPNYDLPSSAPTEKSAKPNRIGSGSSLYNENNDRLEDATETIVSNDMNQPVVGVEPEYQESSIDKLDFPFAKLDLVAKSYRIKNGETVSGIIEDHYGSYNSSYDDIVRMANKSLRFDRLRVNQAIILPRVSRFDLLTESKMNQVYVYFASRIQTAKAEYWSNKLQQSGYPVLIDYKNQNNTRFSRVYIGPFATAKDAQNAIANLDFIDFSDI